MRTRIAPTPSGLVHAGNAWSFLLTWLLARGRGGSIHLRIDDLDTARFREEYILDIFASLEWLGIDWDTGPRSLAEVREVHSQHLRLDAYAKALERLAAHPPLPSPDGPQSPAPSPEAGAGGPLVYACACSREKAKRKAREAGTPGIYPGTCRHAGIPWREAFRGRRAGMMDGRNGGAEAEALPLRLRVPGNAEVTLRGIGEAPFDLRPGREMGDFVVWQRNGEPAYQLASLVDDESLGTDLIVRGADLLPSTGAQAYMAGLLGYRTFAEARFLHHGLVLDDAGGKLSKSGGAISLQGMRGDSRGPGPLLSAFARRLGIETAEPERAADLLAGFAPERIPSGPIAWSDLARETGV